MIYTLTSQAQPLRINLSAITKTFRAISAGHSGQTGQRENIELVLCHNVIKRTSTFEGHLIVLPQVPVASQPACVIESSVPGR